MELNSENIEIVGTPQPLRGPEPDTDKEPDPLGVRKPQGNDPTKPTPAVKSPPTPAVKPPSPARAPLTPYLVVGGLVFAALVIGLAIGRIAALGH